MSKSQKFRLLPFTVLKGGRRPPRANRRSELERLAAQVVRVCPQHTVDFLCGMLVAFLKPDSDHDHTPA